MTLHWDHLGQLFQSWGGFEYFLTWLTTFSQVMEMLLHNTERRERISEYFNFDQQRLVSRCRINLKLDKKENILIVLYSILGTRNQQLGNDEALKIVT